MNLHKLQLELYGWKNISNYNQKIFEKWWIEIEPEFPWFILSFRLCCHCHQYFKIWYDPKKFNWKLNSKHLKQYCEKYKDIWEKDYLYHAMKGEKY